MTKIEIHIKNFKISMWVFQIQEHSLISLFNKDLGRVTPVYFPLMSQLVYILLITFFLISRKGNTDSIKIYQVLI